MANQVQIRHLMTPWWLMLGERGIAGTEEELAALVDAFIGAQASGQSDREALAAAGKLWREQMARIWPVRARP